MTGFDLSVEVKGWAETKAELRELRGAIPAEVKDELARSGFAIYYQLATYPDPRPNQKYVRTFNYRFKLGHELRSEGDMVEMEFTQGASYSRYLRGTADGRYLGAWMHVGRWRSLKDIIDKFAPVVRDKLDRAVKKVIARTRKG